MKQNFFTAIILLSLCESSFALDRDKAKQFVDGVTDVLKEYEKEAAKQRKEQLRLEQQQLQLQLEELKVQQLQKKLQEHKAAEKHKQQIQPPSDTGAVNSGSSNSASVGSLRWPSRGGLEDWGFQRPAGCQTGNLYELPLAEKLKKISNISGVHIRSSNEYTSGETGQFIQNAKANPSAIRDLRESIEVQMENELNQLEDDGEQYIKIASVPYTNGRDVVKAIKRFDIYGVECNNMQGAANSMLCAIQMKALTLTLYYERFVQSACHLGLNTPMTQVTNVSAIPSTSSNNSSNNAQIAPPNTVNNNNNSSQAAHSNNDDKEAPAEMQKITTYTKQNLNAYDLKYQGVGKKHNPDAEASRCLKFIPERKQIFNECDYNVEALFCAINPDPNSTTHAFEIAPYFNCDRNSIGMWPVSSKSALMGRFTAESAALFACKKPSIPGAKFNRDSKSFSGRCSEY